MSVLNRAAVVAGVVLGVLGLVGLSDAALAQDDPPAETSASSNEASRRTPAPRACEIGVKISRVGAGGRARPGEWAAVQVVLTNQTDRLREVLVRAVIGDPDGDRAAYERTIVSNPGATQSVWLYVQLPFAFDSGSSLTVTAHEAEEGGGSDGARFVAGRELGSDSTRLSALVPATVGMLGVVGDRAAALDQYSGRLSNLDYAPTGHELTDLVSLQIADLPDRVMGLAALDTIVWTGAGQGRDPTDLSRDQAAALREWIRRGGHLVVVLPNAGQAWLVRADNPLADVMPAATPVLFEGVDLNPMRRLLTDNANLTLPSSAFIVQAFRPDPTAGPYDAMAVLSVPPDHPATGLAGQPVVIRRLVGQGAVTVVGIDVGRPALATIRGVEADIFWNRVLGRRIDLLKPDELQDKQNKRVFFGSRRDKVLDSGIGGEIAKTAEAAAGLLLAFVVFGLYWLLAGPVGHFVLRRRDLRRHSWLAFVGVAGAFTAIAWGGANLIKAKSVSGNHLTFFDHVYGQPSQRTRSWINVHVPRYGDVRVSALPAGDAAGASDDWHVSIAPWDDPESGSTGWGGFPDSREYTVESRSPDELVVPFRSTAKQFRIDWAGPVRDKWGMPRPVVESPVASPGDAVPQLGREIVLKHEPPNVPGRGWSISGRLVHDLPGELTDVIVVVVPHQDSLRVGPTGALIGDAMAISRASWRPGDVFDLGLTQLGTPSAPVGDRDRGALSAQSWLSGLVRKPSGFRDSMPDPAAQRTAPDDLMALAFFSMLEPPNINDDQDNTYVARRRSTHTWDLGRWFTQPCIIVVGQLAGGPSPTPLLIDGREVELRGRTVVRWVYPLPPDPPEYGPRTDTPAGPAPAAPASGPPRP